MRIERFDDIEAWQLARELTGKVYGLTKRTRFTQDFIPPYLWRPNLRARSTKEKQP
ncbi:MAG: hypothetical protein L6406_14010 [Desulfobacterales bacterium]|nr:hypothetical protein [Pseudomonadota bacterium]MCG2776785.1 hypothetical protein [Desulfobacterales bacterium]